MAKDCDEVAEMMDELGCDGLSVTKAGIESRIEKIEYHKAVICGKNFMFCGITMKGGFVVVGRPSAVIDPANWRDEIAQKVSFDNTFEELWKLEGYRVMAPD